ncbi:Heparan sulfate 2-O-sulfotransferase 1 [Holothuria leucospilota]|uniref:Heparan sulfate 2-O-sulfotransferase 1 n=1 Tax=Holothuria leucospilota TaxID=206669 RepID=A0A9Q0YL16_HOLLE|nr:Heparan sulfate 2-O-sulfotransferase 1 [Holothuria leucospilota]
MGFLTAITRRWFSKTAGVALLCLMILSISTFLLSLFSSVAHRPKSYPLESSSVFETSLDQRLNSKSIKFLSAERKFDLILFHALPKCGSRTFLTLAEWSEDYRNGLMTIDTSLYTLPAAPSNMSREIFMRDFLTRYLEKIPKKYIFLYTHARFVDLRKHEWRMRYVSIIRDPLSRLVSWYYYLRNRDGTNLTRSEMQWRSKLKDLPNETFDQCVQNSGNDCMAKFLSISTTSFFCGYDSKCSADGNFALARAKENVVRHFDVVGIMEDYSSFVQVVESLISPTFSGAVNNYARFQQGTSYVSNMKTQGKILPSKETRQIMIEKLSYDYKFYNFVKTRFYQQKRALGI